MRLRALLAQTVKALRVLRCEAMGDDAGNDPPSVRAAARAVQAVWKAYPALVPGWRD